MADCERMTFPARNQKDFVGYEYKEIAAEDSMVSLLLDGYENFGWELKENLPESGLRGRAGSAARTVLRLRRDRRIVNKMELTRLQRNFEACIAEIQMLEKRKTSGATAWALALGVVGTGFMAGATFAVTAQPPHYVLCILLAVPGFLGWIFPYFLYKKIAGKQTEKITSLIETKYDEIYEICEKGNKLLC